MRRIPEGQPDHSGCSNEIVKNHERYIERARIFKSCGYDIQKERDFILNKSLPLNGTILEVGTGKGYFAVALAQSGYQLTSVDISEEEQKRAKMSARYLGLQEKIDFKVADAGRLDFADKSFDVIFSVNMVHHLSGPFHVVMDEFTRIIKPGGKIIVSDFNKKGLGLVRTIHKSEGRTHPEGKATIDDVAACLEKKGFQTENYGTEFQQTVIAYRSD